MTEYVGKRLLITDAGIHHAKPNVVEVLIKEVSKLGYTHVIFLCGPHVGSNSWLGNFEDKYRIVDVLEG